MSSAVWAVLLALLAAFLIACGSVAQQGAAAEVPDGRSLVAGLVSSTRWWVGLTGDFGGYAVQVLALFFGSVLLVQPTMVATVLFALPLAARYSGLTVTRRNWVLAGLLTASLAVFLVVGNPSEGASDAPGSAWVAPLGIVVGICVVGCIVAAALPQPQVRALVFGTAAGILFGVSVVFTKFVTTVVGDGFVKTVSVWQTWALVAAGASAFYLQQKAFQSGPLSASLPALTIGEPICAAFLGIVVLGERFRASGFGLFVVGASIAVTVISAVLLSRKQASADDLV